MEIAKLSCDWQTTEIEQNSYLTLRGITIEC
jgi:hypothetical protein